MKLILSYTTLLVLLLSIGVEARAQNIVPNPSLENYTVCPTSVAQVDNLIGWAKVTNHGGSSDMINACNAGIVNCPANAFGDQLANTGVGYFGFAAYYDASPGFREYTECLFTSPMVAGTTYDVSFYVSLSDECQFGSDNALQLKFSNAQLMGTGGTQPLIAVVPDVINTVMITDKINWMLMSYQYTALGGEQYMTIGNFDDDITTNLAPAGAGIYGAVYYYVDDFLVEPVTVTCDAAWTTTTACSTDPPINLDALITGDIGGTWSGTGVTGNMFDPSSGTQSITYSSPNICDSTQSIVVTTTAVASWNPPVGVCDGDPQLDLNTLITGTTGGTWSGTGVTGNMFDPSVGTQSITYSAGTAPCDDVSIQNITVGVQTDASWTPPLGLCLGSPLLDLNTLITGTAGGTWSGTGVTGSMFDPAMGSQTLTYDVGTAPCDATSAQLINIVANGDASWTPPLNLCMGDAPINLDALITGNLGGTWSGTGVTGNMFDPATGTQNVTYSVGAVPCDAVSMQAINVNPIADPAWAPAANICESDAPLDLNALITGDLGGSWSGTGVTGNMFDPSGGTQTITYTVGAGGCQANSPQLFTVNTAPDPSWTSLTMCQSSAPVNLTGQITGLAGGTWSGSGMSGSVFDPFNGTQSVTYSVSAGGCTATSVQNVTVVDPQVAVVGSNVSCFGLTDGSAVSNVTNGSGNYTYSWNSTPAQNTANASGIGAGTYIVTVTDVDGGCNTTGTVTIIEPAEITTVMSKIDACAPSFGSATVVAAGGVGGFTYSWNPVTSTDATATGIDSSMAIVTVTDANGCSTQDSIFVNVWPVPAMSISADTLIYRGDEATLNAAGGVSYLWTPSEDLDCDNCASPKATPDVTTQYCVTITDGNGCQNSDCILVTVEIICGDVFVPSGFSPNNDGENDILCVYSDCMEHFTFSIYNRWGEKVYTTSSMTICWDGTWKGKELNSAVFVYVLEGSLINGQIVQQKGNISLIR